MSFGPESWGRVFFDSGHLYYSGKTLSAAAHASYRDPLIGSDLGAALRARAMFLFILYHVVKPYSVLVEGTSRV